MYTYSHNLFPCTTQIPEQMGITPLQIGVLNVQQSRMFGTSTEFKWNILKQNIGSADHCRNNNKLPN